MDFDNFGIFIDTAGEHGGVEVKRVNEDGCEVTNLSPVSQALQDYRTGKLSTEFLSKLKKRENKKTEYELFLYKLDTINLDEPKCSLINQDFAPKSRFVDEIRKKFVEDKQNVKNILEKSEVLKPEFEKLEAVPTHNVSERKLKMQRKKEREKTKGSDWFNLPATEVTEEVKRDLELLQMRSVLDPKRFYKKNDLKVLPKYFQIGKVEDSPLDVHDRLTNKQRKRTLVDELMADAEFNKYNKKKYNEIVAEKQKTHYKAFKAAKKLKRKKK